MEALSSAIRLVQRNLLRDPGYLYHYLRGYLDPDYRLCVPFMSDDEMLTRLYRGKSMIRLGDGEIHIINYGHSTYQDYHPRLRAYLLRIIQGYDAETGAYLLGLPREFLGKSNQELKDLHMLRIWLPSKIAFERLFPAQQCYFDAHLFYRDGAFAQTLERILGSHRTIVVTNPDHIARLKAGLGGRLSARFVSCAPRNAFDRFDELLVRTLSLVEPGQEHDYRVLLAAGPTSKALTYELSKRGIASYDLGRGIETAYSSGTLEHEIYGKYKPTP